MRAFCDLHTHSLYSDGAKTPKELLEEADAIGLSAIALTDHNTVDGLYELMREAPFHKVEAIPGVEISCDYAHDGRVDELHILSLYLPESAYGQVIALAEEMAAEKVKSNRLLIERLQTAGYAVTYEEAAQKTRGIPNRAHVAKVLKEKGYVATEREAFATVLAKGSGFYTEPPRPNAFSVVETIRSFGGVSVLAHPLLNLDKASLLAFLPKAKECGLLAMESEYPLFTPEERKMLALIAKDFSLCESGGSDYHGETKPDLFLGRGKGDLFVPLSFAERMKAVSSFI